MSEFEAEVRQFLVDRFLFGEDRILSAGESLLDTGVLDSTGVLELISRLEEVYGIRVNDDEITRENLDTIAGICAFLEKRKRDPTKRLA